MASGNLGDLFVSLGIKDEMSATLRKIVNGMKGVDQATLDAKKRGEDLIKSLNGINGNNFSKVFRDATKYIEDNSKGLSNIISLLKKVEDKADSNAIASKFFGAKDLPRIAEYLTAINAEFAKMAKDEARADSIKAWQSRISNSLEYIKVLQDIDLWQNKIDSTRSRNPNVNSKELDAAEKSLANIRSQIVGLLSSGGIDTSGVLGSINKLLSIAKRDVSGIISKFKEENPLSVFSGGTAKVEADIARVTEKLAKMRDLMSEGTAKGYSTSMLGGNITELNNLLQRLQSALSNKSMLTDAGQMKNLLSDVALGMTKASAATQAYGREKGKVIAQEREYNKAVRDSNSIQSGDNKRVKVLSEIEILLKNIRSITSESLKLGVDTNSISSIRSEIESIKNALGALSGKELAGQPLKNLLDNFSEVKTRLNDTAKSQNYANKDAEKGIEIYNKYKTEIAEAVKNLERESSVLLRNKQVRDAMSSKVNHLDIWMEQNYRSGGYFRDGSIESINNRIKNLEGEVEKKKKIISDYYEYVVKESARIASLINKAKSYSPFLNGKDANGIPLSGSNLDTFKFFVSQAELSKWSLKRDTDPNHYGKYYDASEASRSVEELINKINQLKEARNKLRDDKLPANNADKEKVLASYKAEVIRKNEELIASERRVAEQISKTNAARRESTLVSRQQAETLVHNRVKELEAQRQQIQALFGKGKDVLSTEELGQVRNAFSQITQEMNTLRSAMVNLGSYSIKDLFAMSRGTSDFSPMISSMNTVVEKKREAVELERQHQAEIAKSAAKVQADLVRGFEKANSSAGKLNSTIQDLKSLFLQGGLVFGAQQFAMSIITTGGEMEKQHIALQSILGDMQNANTLFGQVKELALNSPFTFSELNRDVKQLAAYGVEYDQLYDTTKRLADMSSGLGVSFDRIALAFGQVQARGWLDGKELRQIAYAGIPLLDKLSDFYSKQEGRKVSTSEIKTRISNREVSFDDVKNIFWQMTDAGGQFYNMQQTLSETLLGRYNKLKDAWEIMLADFANGKSIIGSTFKDIIGLATNLVQAIHTIGPAIIAAFSGPLLKKGLVALDGGLGNGILNSKASIASNVQQRILSGKNVSDAERKILQYKNQIRLEDIKTLAKANALNKVELGRLFISGQITKEMYKQGLALAKQEQQSKAIGLMGAFKNLFSGQGIKAAGGMLAGGLMSGFKSVVGFFGGLPGIAISAITSIWSYYEQKKAQLKQDMDTTSEELQDRYTKISEFLRDNNADKAIKSGDETEISNLIESYKEKLKEIAPEKANAFEMGSAEKKSNEDRLKYLKEQLVLLKQVEQETKKRLSDEDTYSDFDDKLKSAKSVAEEYAKSSAKTNMVNATQADFASFNAWSEKYQNEIKNLREFITKQLGDISKDPKLQGQANQILSSFFAKQGWDQDVSDQFRADVLNSMGVSTSFYEEKFKKALDDAVNNTYPWIGDKIRNNQELTSAEKTQVTNLMKDAAAQVQKDYPMASDALKEMLAKDRFEAVIHLVFDAEETDLEKQAGSNTKMAGGDGYAYHRRNNKSKQIAKGAGNSRYKFRQDYSSAVSSAKKEFIETQSELSKGLTTLDAYNAALQNYEDLKQGFREQFGVDWIDADGKKTGKKGGKTGGVKTDKALDDLKKRISLYKKMYAEIKKFNDLYGKGALGQLANDKEFEYIFNNKKLFPISDYTNYETSIKELLGTLPANTKDRIDFKNDEKAGIQSENRKLLEDQRNDELNTLNKQLDIIGEQYDTYKKIYELTGNKRGAMNVAFGGIVQFDSMKKFLESQLDVAVKHDNVQSGLSYSTDEIKNMSLENVKDKYGEKSRTYDVRKKLDDETNKIQKETIDLMAELIDKNATIEQQIEDENRKYERQLELIKNIEDPKMQQRAKEGATKTHNENKAKLQFEQFKQESDWVTIFDDLDRVGTSTINSMVEKIDEFSRTTGLSVEVVKQLRDALDKLRNEQIERNPLPSIFGGVHRGNAIGSFINSRFRKGMDISTTTFVGEKDAKKMGIRSGNYTKDQLESEQQGAYKDSSVALSELTKKLNGLISVLSPVNELFAALGEQDSVLGKVTGGASNALSAAASVSGGLDALGLSSLGPYGAAAGAALSVASSLISAFGADYSSYNKAKAQYDNLTSVWDSLISKKTEYMNIHWGTEATEASKEAQRMLEAEIEQTKIIAQKRLDSGSSAGSHSLWYRMWKGSYKYDGQNWQDVAPEISRKYGVQFNGMEDMLNMNSETLSNIKQDYTGLWATMDGDFRDYLEKLIEYGDKADEMVENLTEKLTGNKFSSLVESWGDAMSQMSNSSDNLVDNFEDNLKKAILNSMIENVYGNQIKALIEKTQKYAENGDKITDGSGNVISEYTGAEYADVKESTDDLSKQIEATRDFLKKTYGWSDNSSSSSTNSVKGITEETADILVSYANAIRLDCSVMRAEQAKFFPEMSEITKSQLNQLNQISQNTLRNAEAAERIEAIFTSYNDNFNKVLNGTKRLNVK